MDISIEKVKEVFIAWNKHCIENPDEINQEPVTLENIDSYSQSQAEEFILRLTELSEKVG